MSGELAKPTMNIKKPLTVGAGVLIVVAIAIAGTWFYLKNDNDGSDILSRDVMSSDFDDDFYNRRDSQARYQIIGNDEQLPSVPEVTEQKEVVPASQEAQRAMVIGGGDNQSARQNGNQAANRQRVERAEDAFIQEKRPSRSELIAQRRAQLNVTRRQVSQYQTTSYKEKKEIERQEAKAKTLPAPKDKDFSEQEIAKDESTYPVDLERTITADRYIDCVLQDQINSQLEGRVVCQVEKNVYGYHGRKILIPAGSKAIGWHGELKKVGEQRFNVEWKRFLRPDGANIKITKGYTADRVGQTGLGGVVNNRNWEKYGGAVLTSTISALAQMSIPTENTIQNQVIQSYGTDIGQVTAAMLNENINIKPFSIVPSGTRLKIVPTTDIWLKDVGSSAMFVEREQ